LYGSKASGAAVLIVAFTTSFNLTDFSTGCCSNVFTSNLYSTFLTRTGVLGDTSVHAFTEAGNVINAMIGIFVLAFTLPMLFLFFKNLKIKITTFFRKSKM